MTESASTSNSKVANRPHGRIRAGERLRGHVEELLVKYVVRMCNDPAMPKAKDLPAALLEDHAMSLLGDFFQTLVVLEENEKLADYDESELLGDGRSIRSLVSELHGRQRHRLGWTEGALDREYEILREELERMVRRYSADAEGVGGVEWALEVSGRLVAQAREASFRGYTGAAAFK